jgi:putative transposase
MIDFTKVGGLLRSIWVGAIIAAFSRRVLAIGVVAGAPTAGFALRLLRDAVAQAGLPRWVVSDKGTQFTSRAFSRALRRRGIRRRFGAVARSGSIALIERFWGSCKRESARVLFLYRPLRRIERDIQAYAHWFNTARPHQGLGNLTPDEVYFRRSTRARAVPLHPALEVRHLDGDRRLPVLRLRPAA